MSQDNEPVDNETEESVREAVEHSRSGAPATGAAIRDRSLPTRSTSALSRAQPRRPTSLPASSCSADSPQVCHCAHLHGPRRVHGPVRQRRGTRRRTPYQLYTENTLPPVALVLERLASVPRLLRIWIVVFLANAVGAGIGAYVLANTGVLSLGAVEAASTFGTEDLETSWWDLFYQGVFAAFIVAGVLGGECFVTQ
ncbi:formate/nitrite transporter family protein [Halalkalicoccus tibetensis]|uniref:Formate/nitrite transporter family protein n=1 Tax=Halalkalicoccus tibetensis TaxID=175632 RepID=A0ABD5V9E7_9EURY